MAGRRCWQNLTLRCFRMEPSMCHCLSTHRPAKALKSGHRTRGRRSMRKHLRMRMQIPTESSGPTLPTTRLPQKTRPTMPSRPIRICLPLTDQQTFHRTRPERTDRCQPPIRRRATRVSGCRRGMSCSTMTSPVTRPKPRGERASLRPIY